jgi:hypothetical protein
MSHKSYRHTHLATAVRTSGHNQNLGAGEVALVVDKVTSGGLKVIAPSELRNWDFTKTRLSLVVGSSRGGSKSVPVKKLEFLGIEHPVMWEPSSVIYGHDGVDNDKTIDMSSGNQTINVKFGGEGLKLIGMPESMFAFSYTFEKPQVAGDCGDSCAPVPCKPIVSKGIDAIRNYKLPNGFKFGDFFTVAPIYSCDTAGTAPSTEDATFYCITKCDEGSDLNLSELQSTLKEGKVYLESRNGGESTYKVMIVDPANAPTTFVSKSGSILKGCAVCPTGFTELKGGFVYSVKLDDEGVDKTSVVEGISGDAVAGSVVRFGEGGYFVTLEVELSDADRATFVTANPTAKIGFVGCEESMCANPATITSTWAECGTCEYSTAKYRINLPLNNCDGVDDSRLAELEAFYPNNTVTMVKESNCRGIYEITVNTNVVCASCNTENFESEAPGAFEGQEWVFQPAVDTSADCVCGFEIVEKPIEMFPPLCLSEDIGSITPGMWISVTKGVNTEAGWNTNEESSVVPPVIVKNGKMGTQYGMNILNNIYREERIDTGINATSLAERFLQGSYPMIEPGKQYSVARVKVINNYITSGTSNRITEEHVYNFVLPKVDKAIVDYFKALSL